MCLLFFAYDCHPDYRLILAANRDEYYDRPTEHAKFWESYPEVFAGQDLEMMGTWMGITKSGRFAALTNYRDPSLQIEGGESRGLLVRDFLCSDQAPEAYLREVAGKRERYNPFNLLVGDGDKLCYFSKLTAQTAVLAPGIYGLSNHFLDTPWPKVRKSKQALTGYLANRSLVEPGPIFEMLADAEPAEDQELPDTGVSKKWEKYLSSVFIRGEDYGTRSSTVLLVDRQDRVLFWEKSFLSGQTQGAEVRQTFELV